MRLLFSNTFHYAFMDMVMDYIFDRYLAAQLGLEALLDGDSDSDLGMESFLCFGRYRVERGQ